MKFFRFEYRTKGFAPFDGVVSYCAKGETMKDAFALANAEASRDHGGLTYLFKGQPIAITDPDEIKQFFSPNVESEVVKEQHEAIEAVTPPVLSLEPATGQDKQLNRLNERIVSMTAGDTLYIENLSNEVYHASNAISNSSLSLVAESPALLEWQANCPQETVSAFDLGNAVHTLILEPHKYDDEYIVAPSFNLRTNQGKEDKKEFYEKSEGEGKIILSAEDDTKARTMAASAFAHPTVKKLFSLPGVSEASFFWVDPETGIVCKCRPDRYVKTQPIIIDVKTTDKIELFDKSIHDFRYYVQDAFYSEGFQQVMEQTPSFFFLVIGKHKSAGRHPVRIFELDAWDKEDGDYEFRANLQSLKDANETGDFKGIQTIKRRFYRKLKDNLL